MQMSRLNDFIKNYKKGLTIPRIIMAILMSFIPTLFFSIFITSFVREIDVYVVLCSLLLAIALTLFTLTDWTIAKLATTFFLLMSAICPITRPLSKMQRMVCIFFAIETFVYVYLKPLKRR